jgi:hypothetical protein
LDTARYFTACVFDYCAAGDSIPSIAEYAVAGFKAQCVFEGDNSYERSLLAELN